MNDDSELSYKSEEEPVQQKSLIPTQNRRIVKVITDKKGNDLDDDIFDSTSRKGTGKLISSNDLLK